MIYWVYKDVTSQWRWRLRAGNNRIIAVSGEAYHNRSDCVAAIGLNKGSTDAPIRDE
ncbi:MAG: DUF1508 domain-containing protein [Hyphomicrobiales bacterium]|nr:DUF1508 domain-containing protein [Hyphomicrobiales bacterium]